MSCRIRDLFYGTSDGTTSSPHKRVQLAAQLVAADVRRITSPSTLATLGFIESQPPHVGCYAELELLLEHPNRASKGVLKSWAVQFPLRFRFQNNVKRCLSGASELTKPSLFHDLAQASLPSLRSERQANFLALGSRSADHG